MRLLSRRTGSGFGAIMYVEEDDGADMKFDIKKRRAIQLKANKTIAVRGKPEQ